MASAPPPPSLVYQHGGRGGQVALGRGLTAGARKSSSSGDAGASRGRLARSRWCKRWQTDALRVLAARASARSPACAHLVTRCAIGRARCASCCSANASIRTAPSVALRGMRRARPWPSFGPGGVRQGRSRHASKCRRHGALVNLQENVDLVGDRADRALDGKPERCVLVLVEGVQHAFVSRLKAKLGKLGGLCDDAELRTVEAGGALTSREVCPDRTMRSRARR